MEFANDKLDMDDFIHSELAKIANIKARMIRRIYSSPDLTLEIIEELRAELSDWYNKSPKALQLFGASDLEESVGSRAFICFVHVFHLSAIMILFRHMMMQFTKAPLDRSLIWRVEEPIADSLLAAKQTARILHLVLGTGYLFQKCWLCM